MQAHLSKTGSPADDKAWTDENRLRVLAGLAAAVSEKGYAATTIADIVRHARLSKRTFYEHFEDKESCFLASYEMASELALQTIADAASHELPWDERLRAATTAYFSALEAQPELTRTFLLEINAAGPRAREMRLEVHQRFAEQLRKLVDGARRERPELRGLSQAMATAIVGGINELLLVAVEKGRAGKLRELAQTATELIQAVLTAPRG